MRNLRGTVGNSSDIRHSGHIMSSTDEGRAGARHATGTANGESPTGSPWLMLALATIGFAMNFWAWALISPLGPLFRDRATSGP